MWTRKELKEKAKVAFKGNYWKSVLVGIVSTLAIGATASASANSGNMDQFQMDVNSAVAQSGVSLDVVVGILAAVLGVSLLISFVINAFIRQPLNVSVSRFFLENAKNPATLKELKYPFGNGRYLKTVGAMFLRDLFIGLWSLLLIVPGIIKSYDYYLVDCILADDPDMSAMDALRKSKEMMKGHRWNAFVLNLSFLGWYLLSALTFGLLDIFYVKPYICATDAELYLALKK